MNKMGVEKSPDTLPFIYPSLSTTLLTKFKRFFPDYPHVLLLQVLTQYLQQKFSWKVVVMGLALLSPI